MEGLGFDGERGVRNQKGNALALDARGMKNKGRVDETALASGSTIECYPRCS